MQNEISKKELVRAQLDEKMTEDEYLKMIVMFFKTEMEGGKRCAQRT